LLGWEKDAGWWKDRGVGEKDVEGGWKSLGLLASSAKRAAEDRMDEEVAENEAGAKGVFAV